MAQILNVHAREVLDSRGNPTLEVEVVTDEGAAGRAAVPSGARGAVELRDGDRERYGGMGVLRAVENVNTAIAEGLRGLSVFDQRGLDSALAELDGTDSRENLGTNAMLGVSLAVAHAAAQTLGQPLYRYVGGVSAHALPVPLMSVRCVAPQELMLLPVGAETFADALRMGVEIFHALESSVGLGSEDGVRLSLEAVEKAGYKSGEDVLLVRLDAQGGKLLPVDGEQRAARQLPDVAWVQLGKFASLTELIDAVAAEHRSGKAVAMCLCSGEAEDATAADLAVALGVELMCLGAPSHAYGVAKCNQLLRVEEALGGSASLALFEAIPR